MKNTTQQPLKRKWTGSIDNRGNFQSALCLVFVMLSRLFIAALWSPAGKELTSWLLFVVFNCTFVIFPCCILVWFLIVLIPDLCPVSLIKRPCRRIQRGLRSTSGSVPSFFHTLCLFLVGISAAHICSNYHACWHIYELLRLL